MPPPQNSLWRLADLAAGSSWSIHGRADVTSRYEVLSRAGPSDHADIYRSRRRFDSAAVELKDVHDAVSARREADALLAVSGSSPHVVARFDHFLGGDCDDNVLIGSSSSVSHSTSPRRRTPCRAAQAVDATGPRGHRRLPPRGTSATASMRPPRASGGGSGAAVVAGGRRPHRAGGEASGGESGAAVAVGGQRNSFFFLILGIGLHRRVS
ncbi:hypothetical protein ACP70R_018781 [Stipagrostis hirtigluma subsp. patula]